MNKVLLTLSVLAGLALISAPAQAKPPERVSCGQTITHSVKMANDLTNCPNNGLLIGADNITLDLNGHTIDGDGKQVDNCPPPPGPDCDVGVQNAADYNGVTVEGGKLREFSYGVFIFGAENRVSHYRVRHLSSTHNLFRGILFGGVTDSQIERNSTNDNGPTTGGGGVVLFGSQNIRIERNDVSGNGDLGVLVPGGSDNNRIAKNSVSGNPFAGIAVDGDSNVVSHNRVYRNGDNVGVGGSRNRVTGNVITDAVGCPNEDDPGTLACGYGLQIAGGEGNLVADNRLARVLNDTIAVASFDPENPTVGTVVRDNIVRDAGVDGISVGTDVNGNPALVTDTLLLRNTAIGAGDDGIDVDSVATTLTRNRAFRNDGLGIEAEHGVTDGGGNRAAGNGNPQQCTNVLCR
jgi:parallel beta-helix repeat protein